MEIGTFGVLIGSHTRVKGWDYVLLVQIDSDYG
jgi:hypothetical protein